MIAIILASGRGVRMGALTENTPKPMLKVLGKNLIEWKLEALPEVISEIVLIVGYKKEIIMDYFGSNWQGIPITYIEQKVLDGTGGAIAICKDVIKDKALFLYGDDIYNKEDLEKLCDFKFAMGVYDDGEKGLAKKGQILEKDGVLVGINEGTVQTGIPSSLIFTGAGVISKEYFNYPAVKFSETEYGLPHTLVLVSKDIPVHTVRATKWIQITAPESLAEAEEILSKN